MGDTICIEAIALVYNVHVTVYVSPACYMVEFNETATERKRHLRLASINNRHFRALVPAQDLPSPAPLSDPFPPLLETNLLQMVRGNLSIEDQCRCLGRQCRY